MAIAWGLRARAAAVLVAPLVMFAATVGAVDLLGLAPAPPGYYSESVSLPLATCPNETTVGPIYPTFHGVTFNISVTDVCGPAGPDLVGTVTEANGTVFPFHLWSLGCESNCTWFSPDRDCGVDWVGGVNQDIVILMVRA